MRWKVRTDAAIIPESELARTSSETSRFRRESWKGCFSRQKNIFVFTSLKFWGEKGPPIPTIQRGPKPRLFWKGQAREDFHLGYQRDFKGAVTLVGFQDLCFEFNELF